MFRLTRAMAAYPHLIAGEGETCTELMRAMDGKVAIKAATEEVAGETAAGYGIDGCSAPNFAMSVTGLARAMQAFASASDSGDTRSRAMHRLTRAMATYPENVAGEGRACTELMRAMGHKVAHCSNRVVAPFPGGDHPAIDPQDQVQLVAVKADIVAKAVGLRKRDRRFGVHRESLRGSAPKSTGQINRESRSARKRGGGLNPARLQPAPVA